MQRKPILWMSAFVLFLITGLVASSDAGLAGPSAAQGATARQTGAQPLPPRGWGISLVSDRAYYGEGDTLRARLVLTNFTPEDAYGTNFAIGGNGCEYLLSVYDINNDVVWEPDSGCFFSMRPWELLAQTSDELPLRVPLVYQNNDGIGVQGAELPPGFYELRGNVIFSGPRRQALHSPGKSFSVGIPFQIEP